ncbi:MAG: hypothetical protein AB1333_00365 [Patescibacteria group bacterium]
MYSLIKNKKGSLMVELMVTATLIMVGLIGIFSLLIHSTSMNKNVVHRFEATYLAAEGIEIMKHIIDTDVAIPESVFFNSTLDHNQNYEVQYDTDKDLGLTEIFGSSTTALWLNEVTGLYGYNAAGKETPYKRTVTVGSGGNEMTIKSEVEWVINGERSVVNLEEIFQNWREK